MKRLWFLIILLTLFLFSSVADAALTLSDTDVDEWAEIAQNAVREGDVEDISGNYFTFLHIDMALTSAAVHTGTKITVFVSSKSVGDGSDEDWTVHAEFIGPIALAAPNPESLGGAEAAGQTTIEVASTTGLYEDDETRWVFLEDDTVADSEMIRLESYVSDVSITITNGLTNAHDASDTLYDVADNQTVLIQGGYQRFYIEYDNTYDSDGATTHTRCRRTNVTAL